MYVGRYVIIGICQNIFKFRNYFIMYSFKWMRQKFMATVTWFNKTIMDSVNLKEKKRFTYKHITTITNFLITFRKYIIGTSQLLFLQIVPSKTTQRRKFHFCTNHVFGSDVYEVKIGFTNKVVQFWSMRSSNTLPQNCESIDAIKKT